LRWHASCFEVYRRLAAYSMVGRDELKRVPPSFEVVVGAARVTGPLFCVRGRSVFVFGFPQFRPRVTIETCELLAAGRFGES
jgi:hypothetical protein